MRSTALGGMLVALFVTVPVYAGPQPTIDLRWVAPPGCPQESDVRGRIQKILGSGRHESPLRAEGTVTRIDRRFRLELVVHLGDVVGTRGLESSSCEDLAGAAAVEIGLLVHSVEAAAKPNYDDSQSSPSPAVGESGASGSGSDGGSGLSSPGGTAASPAVPVPEGARTERRKEVESETEEPPPQAEMPRSWHFLVQAPVAALGVGPLPPPSLGAGLSLGFEHARWLVQAQGLSWRRQNVPASGFPGYGTDVDRIGARLLTCHELRFSRFGIAPCLVAGIERISASGTGSNILPSSRHATGVNAGAGLQGRLHLASWIRLVLAINGEIELVRPQLLMQGLGPLAPPAEDMEPPDPPTPVYRLAPAALAVTLGLEWAL